jgi:hypothetical protein
LEDGYQDHPCSLYYSASFTVIITLRQAVL